jgi:uncharacterized membrane protein
MSRLRRWFLTGFFVTVPLVVSVTALMWMFRFVDGLTQGLYERWLGAPVPGLGLVTTLLIVLTIGIVATNVIGRRILGRGEAILMHVPVFRTVYAPVKQLILAFSPDNEYGFKRVVMVEDAAKGFLLGFLTREFTVTEGAEARRYLAVYVPTNHLYLGDVLVCPPERVRYPDLTVEQGIRVFLTGGTGLPAGVQAGRNLPGHFPEPGV